MSGVFERLCARWLALSVASTGCATLVGLDGDYRDASAEAAGVGTGGGDDMLVADAGARPVAGTTSSQGGSGGSSTTLEPTKLGRVLSGQVTIDAGAAERSVDLDAVAEKRSILIFGVSFDSTNASRTEVSGQLTSRSQAVFRRLSNAAAAPDVPVTYHVAEFDSGVHVQRGSAALNAAVTRVKLDDAAPLNRSVALVTFRNAGTFYGLDDHVRAKLTSETELTLEMYQASDEGVAEWQVVTFDDAEVQTGDVKLGGSALTQSAALLTPLEPARTWLLFSYQVADIGNGAADLMVRGRVEPTQITFERSANGASAALTYYTVDFGQAATAQRGEATLAAGTATGEIAIDSVEPGRSFAVAGGNYSRCGSTSLASANNPGSSTFRLALEPTRLTAVRGQSTTEAVLAWQVLEFR